MAFFKLRKNGEEAPAAAAAPADSIEAMRRRARHRLIGAAVLVVAGVIGFPLLFDTQPRPVAVDIPIDIPDRNKTPPLAPRYEEKVAVGRMESASQAAKSVASHAAPAAAAAPPAAAASADRPAARAEPRPQDKPAPARAPANAAEVRAAAKPASVPADGQRALDLLEGKTPAGERRAPAVEGNAATEGSGEMRFIVQVGAFADAEKARETRQKVERAGLKTYTHVAETKDGKRIRVRVGPFASRAEADKAASRIKDLDLPAAILSL